jgi:hypothetical protein
MRTYKAFYRNKVTVVHAETSYDAQLAAAKIFRAKKAYDVAVVLCDVPLSTSSIG